MATPTSVSRLGIRIANAVTAAAYNSRVAEARAPVGPHHFTTHSANTTAGTAIPDDDARKAFCAYVYAYVNTEFPVETSARLHTLLFGEQPFDICVSRRDMAPIHHTYIDLISQEISPQRIYMPRAAARYADAVVDFAIAAMMRHAETEDSQQTFAIPDLWTGAAAVIRLDITQHFSPRPQILHDLSCIDFRDVPARGLRRANDDVPHFAGAILDDSLFYGLNCSRFNFSGSSCRGTQFGSTVLSGANFVGARIDERTNFTRAIGGEEIPGRESDSPLNR